MRKRNFPFNSWKLTDIGDAQFRIPDSTFFKPHEKAVTLSGIGPGGQLVMRLLVSSRIKLHKDDVNYLYYRLIDSGYTDQVAHPICKAFLESPTEMGVPDTTPSLSKSHLGNF